MTFDLGILTGAIGGTAARSGSTPDAPAGARLEHREQWLRELISAAGLDRLPAGPPGERPVPPGNPDPETGDDSGAHDVEAAQPEPLAPDPFAGDVSEGAVGMFAAYPSPTVAIDTTAGSDTPLPSGTGGGAVAGSIVGDGGTAPLPSPVIAEPRPAETTAGAIRSTAGLVTPTTGVETTAGVMTSPGAVTTGAEVLVEATVVERASHAAPAEPEGSRRADEPSGSTATRGTPGAPQRGEVQTEGVRPAVGEGSTVGGPVARDTVDAATVYDAPVSSPPDEAQTGTDGTAPTESRNGAAPEKTDGEPGPDSLRRPEPRQAGADSRTVPPADDAEADLAGDEPAGDDLPVQETADGDLANEGPTGRDATRTAAAAAADELPGEEPVAEDPTDADASNDDPAIETAAGDPEGYVFEGRAGRESTVTDATQTGNRDVVAPAPPVKPETPIDAPRPVEPARPRIGRARGIRAMSMDDAEAPRRRGGATVLEEVAETVRDARHRPGFTLPETASERAHERSAITRLDALRRQVAESLSRIDHRWSAGGSLALDVPEPVPAVEPAAVPIEADRGVPSPPVVDEPGAIAPKPGTESRARGGGANGNPVSDGGAGSHADVSTTGTGATYGAGRAPGGSQHPEAVPIRHELLAQAILARARAVPRNGSIQLRFALQPQDLGQVRVRIESLGEHLRVEIAAASNVAVDTLHGGLARLTHQLQEAGFRDPDVSLMLDQGGQDRGARDASGDGGFHSDRGPGTGRNGRSAAPGNVTGDRETDAPEHRPGAGRLNLFA